MDSGSRFGKGTRLEGEIVAEESLSIGGEFKGSIEAKADEVIVSENADVEADIVAATISVSGKVKGSINGLKAARFTPTSVMSGKLITTSDFVVEKGAVFRGQVEYRNAGDKPGGTAAAKSGGAAADKGGGAAADKSGDS